MCNMQTLDELVSLFDTAVTYVPLRSEVDFHTLLRDTVGKAYQIAPRASLDPEVEATAAIAVVRERTACILLPGRAFDALGTRHGQGGGWYDQFLALIPKEWIRIGFCHASQFSETTLVKNSWDQPVDYVVVVNEMKRTYRIIVTNVRWSR
jgi:5-formyltetrahydrofolate cyclo-ligase